MAVVTYSDNKVNFMSSRFSDRIAFISGGASGIGAASAKRLAAEGGLSVICGRHQAPLEQVVNEIRAQGNQADWLIMDTTDEMAVNSAITEIINRYGRLDILVNNAATVVRGQIDGSASADWFSCLQGSLSSIYFCTRAALPHMKRQQYGVIVNISSVCGLLGAPAMGAYSAAKAGMIGFSRVAALEGAPDNIRVNVVVPGTVMTPPTAAALSDDKSMAASLRAIPLKRIAKPEEIASAILFLASEEASYITGTTLTVDGGKTCQLNTRSTQMSD